MFTELLSTREPESFGRGQKICEYVRLVAPALKLSQTWDIEVAAMLARIGWMALPAPCPAIVPSWVAPDPRETDMIARVPGIRLQRVVKNPAPGARQNRALSKQESRWQRFSQRPHPERPDSHRLAAAYGLFRLRRSRVQGRRQEAGCGDGAPQVKSDALEVKVLQA